MAVAYRTLPKTDPTERQARAAARELRTLQARNARLQAEAQKLRRSAKMIARGQIGRKTAPVVAAPFAEPVDPRRRPAVGSRVLPPLTPPLLLGRQMASAVIAELRAMTMETRTLVRALAGMPDAKEQTSQAMDALPDDAQRRLKALQARWQHRFAMLAETWSRRMIAGVVSQSSAQLNLGLKGMAERMSIQSTMSTPRMRAVVEAATLSSTSLITRIPERFLGEVQVQVMSAITTGTGLNKLVPFLTKKYKGDARHAQLTALDQIRKASANVNAARLQSLGVEEYVWMAIGGERYPRKLHHEKLNGRTFRYDKPPVIDERTGVRGKPGDAIGCRCQQRAVLNFTKMREGA